MTNELWSHFQNNDGKMIHKWTHYFPIYEQHFSKFQNRPFLFIEIGCGKGGSAKMWKRYFGPHVQIVGLDINPACKEFEEDQISIRIGDQGDVNFLTSVLEEFGAPGVVLDDGSHMMAHVRQSFSTLYPRMEKDGVYAVEDMHTAYWPSCGGGLLNPASFIELSKALIDELNGDHTENKTKVTEFTRSTMSMHFYDSVIVFEKGANRPSRSMASENGLIWDL